ncbi:hypothetical protein HKX48_006195 [Thoreauomyces humboldtii]|nr:hypothetical protein HKX48_006195 [Thoreauomyces humboldtii]
MKVTLATVSAAIVLASSAQAQVPSVGSYLNSGVPSTCSPAFTSAALPLFTSCGLSEALGLLSSPATTTLAQLMQSKTFIPNVCSSACTTAYGAFATPVEAACGSGPLLAASTVAGVPDADKISQLDATDLLNAVSWARGVLCTQSGSSYCAQTTFAAAGGNYQEILTNQTVYCTPCGQAVVTALKTTTGLPASLVPDVNSLSANATQALASCPAGSLTANATASTTASKSGASKTVVGSLAGLAAVALSVIVA